MARISLKSIMLMVVYAAICSMVYISPNLWIGWLVVIATATWMAIAIVRATQTKDPFTLGFAVAGCVWLIVWLGFAIETPLSIDGKNVRAVIHRIIHFGRPRPEVDPKSRVTTYAQLHDLYVSGPMGSRSAVRHAPNWYNAIRLLVCLIALGIATVGGAVFHFGYRRLRATCRQVAAGPAP